MFNIKLINNYVLLSVKSFSTEIYLHNVKIEISKYFRSRRSRQTLRRVLEARMQVCEMAMSIKDRGEHTILPGYTGYSECSGKICRSMPESRPGAYRGTRCPFRW